MSRSSTSAFMSGQLPPAPSATQDSGTSQAAQASDKASLYESFCRSLPVPIKELTSKPFTFIVGPEKKEFHIHRDVVARISEPLNVLVNGNMTEAAEGKVEWPDVDEETFIRFSQYAYTGEYVEAEPRIIDEDSDEGRGIAKELQTKIIRVEENLLKKGSQYPHHSSLYEFWGRALNDTCDASSNPPKRRKLSDRNPDEERWARKYVLAQGICSFRYKCLVGGRCSSLYRDSTSQQTINCGRAPMVFYDWKPRPNPSAYESYVPVFNSHAKLFLFADKYLIDSLKSLAYHRLHRTLFNFKVHFPVRIRDVLELVRLLWTQPTPHQLRHMVYCFLKLVKRGMWNPRWFQDFLTQVPGFTRDVVYWDSSTISLV
ncbi:hypothetical protein NLU13_0706 [Sarocladium strictum]|uniref:BTB domain-containing protein n=1 Tax=Sarocladium strictum TaxID=5046 RepID=A0AA39LBP0_SARSR|nr:hypothetical protein NLU13_0706 [Sarocladium strictum]